MRADAIRLSMAHPGDLSGLQDALARNVIRADEIVAIIGKTEGNGGVNDFTRGYFTQTLMALLSRELGDSPEALIQRIPCVLSGGTEGVLSPHYVVLSRSGDKPAIQFDRAALAIGTSVSAPMGAEHVGRARHVESVAAAVKAALAQACITDRREVHFVQVKCPCITSARAEAAKSRGQTVITTDPNRSMTLARAAGAFGVALALGEIESFDESALLRDFDVFSSRASVSSGIEVDANEVIVLGNSRFWSGDLRIAHRPMADALDLGAVTGVLHDLGIEGNPQIAAADVARLRAVLVKCEPDRRGRIRGHRHTMLEDTDINAQRHIRGALGGVVASVTGDGRIFVSGGAEHQGPDGGGLIAVIAECTPSVSRAN